MSRGRPSIGKAIFLLGLILFTMFAYNTWVKQNDVSPVPPQAALQESVAPSPQTDGALGTGLSDPRMVELADLEIREARVTEPGELPASSHTATLDAIRDLIEFRKEAEAEATLTTLPQDILDDPQLRPFVAILWNNLGVLRKERQATAASIKAFEAGLAFDPESRALNLNVAHAYWETRDPGLTIEFLEHLVEVAPNEALPHLLLVELLYEQDELATATYHLEVATQLGHTDPQLKSYLMIVTEKIKRAEKAERKFLARESSHFVVKFDGEEDHEIWDEVLGILEDAYREIGQNFGYFPSKPITVVLHTRKTFKAATGSPAWADGLYDRILGRIKIPTQGALTDRTWLTRVLRHEFVHALLHERMGARLGAVPQWLNEGLAMQLAGDPWPDIDQLIQGEITLIPLNYLEGGWGRLPAKAARVAYLEGNSATLYLIDRYGMEKVREILSQLATGQPIGAAIKDRLFISYEQFQHRWSDHLNDKIAANRTS